MESASHQIHALPQVADVRVICSEASAVAESHVLIRKWIGANRTNGRSFYDRRGDSDDRDNVLQPARCAGARIVTQRGAI